MSKKPAKMARLKNSEQPESRSISSDAAVFRGLEIRPYKVYGVSSREKNTLER